MQAQHKVRESGYAARRFETAVSPVRDTRNFPTIVDGRYEVMIAANAAETASALRLRHDVFSIELGGKSVSQTDSRLEFDAYDFKCRHLIVIERETGATVGTYRLNTIETAGSTRRFYSANEFTIDDLPEDVLGHGIEIGRACIAKEHRNTKVLFLLWKALIAYLDFSGKRYFFGCCSIFTQDIEIGRRAFNELQSRGYVHESFLVAPKHDGIPPGNGIDNEPIELPALFNMYLRLGARVCSQPMIDRDFGTVDFFVVFDVREMNEKYRCMFA